MVRSGCVRLGEIDILDGILVILDPGLARFWRGDDEPSSPRSADPPEHDLVIVGPDAEATGRAYDREFEPLHLYDRPDPEEAKEHFDAFAKQRGASATASILARRVPHTERARLALAAGNGLGVVKYNGLWAVVASVPPQSRQLVVEGAPLADGEFAGRWGVVDVVLDARAEIASEESVQGVMVEHGQLMFAGLGPLGNFRMWESLDGLADYVFWGSDAKSLAGELGASKLADGEFGWRDIAMEAVGQKADAVRSRIKRDGLKVGADYRPHCNLGRLNAVMRGSAEDAAEIALEGGRVVGCGNRWGDGIFSVSRLKDAAGATVRIRVNLGAEDTQRRMRQVLLRSLGAMVTRKVLDGGEPIRFAERMAPHNARDSGWLFCAGTEKRAYMANARNFAIVQVAALLERFPELAEIVDAPEGAKFRRDDGDRFVSDGE